MQEAARARNIELSIHRVASGKEIAAAIDMAHANGSAALNVLASPLLMAYRRMIMDRVAVLHLPTMYQWNIVLSVALGMALGVAQIGWELARKKPIDAMQWLSLFLVMGYPRFVMVKPSLIYLVVGVVMLKPGWMNRYLPPVA
jgi:hypothetical protein